MLEHHLQKAIVYQLAFTPKARFSDLKPDDIENKLFTYHLHKVVVAGYIEKTDDGLYQLTPLGRRLGLSALKSDNSLLDKAYSVLFLVVRRTSDKAWLLYTRQRQPLIGLTGLAQARPIAHKDVLQSAREDLEAKTGLCCTFIALGSGYFHIFKQDELESFTHFTLLVCEAAEGELTQNDQDGTYTWVINPDFTAEHMLPTMATLAEQYQKAKPFFIDKTFTL